METIISEISFTKAISLFDIIHSQDKAQFYVKQFYFLGKPNNDKGSSFDNLSKIVSSLGISRLSIIAVAIS